MVNDEHIARTAKKMQDEIAHLRERMNAFIVAADSKDGLVQIKINGNHRVKDISFTSNTLPDQAKLTAGMIEAFNLAIEKADMELEKRMALITQKYTIEAINKTNVKND